MKTIKIAPVAAALAGLALLFGCELPGSSKKHDHLSIHYGFEESSGAAILNSDGEDFDGQLNGASRVPGKIGNGVQFSTGSNAIIYPSGEGFPFKNDKLSFEAWVYAETGSLTGTTLLLGDLPEDGDVVAPSQTLAVVLDNGKLRLLLCPDIGGDFFTVIVASAAVPAETWTHVAVTYDGTTAKTYVNGTLDNTANVSYHVPTVYNPLYLGAGENFDLQFAGKLDEVSLENTVWSADKVLQAYQAAD